MSTLFWVGMALITGALALRYRHSWRVFLNENRRLIVNALIAGILACFPSYISAALFKALDSVGDSTWNKVDYSIFAIIFIMLFCLFFMLVEFARRLFRGQD